VPFDVPINNQEFTQGARRNSFKDLFEMRYSQLPMLLPILHLKDIHRRLLRGSSQASLARLLARRFNGISSSDFLRGKHLDERLCCSRKGAADSHIRCYECGGWIDVSGLGSVVNHAGPLPHPAIDQPQ